MTNESTEFYGHLIDGKETEAQDGRRFPSVDPWRRTAWAEAAEGGREDADRAVAAARQAFDTGEWPRMGHTARGRILHRLADLVERNAGELAAADSRDMGRPVAQARAKDVPRAAANFRFFADHARLTAAEQLPADNGTHVYTRYEPAGVVAAIAPWNLPLMLESWKVAPALAHGNTVVLKPAEQSPASATVLARLALEAGVPPGVFNVLHGHGPAAAGEFLVSHPGVDRITFTGESATGRAIARAAADHLTPLSLELGGKAANLVFADCDLDRAVSWSVAAAYTNAGQVCLAGSRIYVERAVYDAFLERFTAAADALRFGDPAEAGTDIGPLASAEHHAKVRGFLDRLDGGPQGRLLTGGLDPRDPRVVRPAVVVDAAAEAAVLQQEIFGPVAVVTPFDTEQQAVAQANATPYGLNAMVFTEDLRRAHRTAAALRGGTVWVNCYFVRDLRAPFGGVGASGIGREGGVHSREFFTEPKAVVMDIAGTLGPEATGAAR
ncbi:aldehyde dehydrogenase [Streptomyces sp. B1866]|uniref:aldehyde dehydrogenase n=1 Tax=Streptomyces sp. B1866 TaxID=3075431 RepID=UPI00288D014B|nr:aldehyde dehydrogenase [Streptomyces sp. B1866]MDT3396533.1 aldehyde dehydrogenase [Streptomyces sp. B1866]